MLTNLKEKIQNIILFVFMVFIGLVMLLVYLVGPTEYNNLSIRFPFICKESIEGFTVIEEIHFEEDISICFSVKPSSENNQRQMSLYVLPYDKNQLQKAVYFDLVWINSKTKAIPINIYLSPGKYHLKLLFGKNLLYDLPLVIFE